MKKPKKKRVKPRDPFFVSAKFRKAGPMSDRRRKLLKKASEVDGLD